MRDQIIKHIQQIELENNVIILYACESGSRAWGFPSKDCLTKYKPIKAILSHLKYLTKYSAAFGKAAIFRDFNIFNFEINSCAVFP